MQLPGFTIWFTGLPCSGKSTISEILAETIKKERGMVEILDGDVIRTNLSKGLGFSREDRETNLKRIAFVCTLLTRNGVPNIAAAISPFQNVREYARESIGNYVEVYTRCSLEACIERDVKGMYKKASGRRDQGIHRSGRSVRRSGKPRSDRRHRPGDSPGVDREDHQVPARQRISSAHPGIERDGGEGQAAHARLIPGGARIFDRKSLACRTVREIRRLGTRSSEVE